MQDDARAEIIALCARYHDALHRSDAELLGSLFHDKALYATTTDGDIRFWSMDRYLPVVAQRPSPSARGEAADGRVVAGPTRHSPRCRVPSASASSPTSCHW